MIRGCIQSLLNRCIKRMNKHVLAVLYSVCCEELQCAGWLDVDPGFEGWLKEKLESDMFDFESNKIPYLNEIYNRVMCDYNQYCGELKDTQCGRCEKCCE